MSNPSLEEKWKSFTEDLRAVFQGSLTRTADELNKLVIELAKLEGGKQPENFTEIWKSALSSKQNFCDVVEAEKNNIMKVDAEAGAEAVRRVLDAAVGVITPRSQSIFDKLFASYEAAGSLQDEGVMKSKFLYDDVRAEWYLWESLLQVEDPAITVNNHDGQVRDIESASVNLSVTKAASRLTETSSSAEFFGGPFASRHLPQPGDGQDSQKDAESRLREQLELLKDLEGSQGKQASTLTTNATHLNISQSFQQTTALVEACFPQPSQQHIPGILEGEEKLSDRGSQSSGSRRSSVSSIR